MKELEGQTVWLRPTGNNARCSVKDTQAKVLKVARVNVTIQKEGYRRNEKLRYDGRMIMDYCNAGYQVYESLEELESWRRASALAHKIQDKCKYALELRELSESNLLQIASLLGIDTSEGS